jgi:hypothetical protein
MQLKNNLRLVDTLERNVANNTNNMITKNIVEQIGGIKVDLPNILNRDNF